MSAFRFVKGPVAPGTDLGLHMEPAYEIVSTENEKGSRRFHFFCLRCVNLDVNIVFES